MASTASAMMTSTAAAASHHSPRYSVSSPQSRRAGKGASAWTQILHGESETIAISPSPPSEVAMVSASSSTSSMAEEESSEYGNASGGNAGKRTAWNKPSNGDLEIGAVMGADSWPPLSELARGGATKSSSESLKGLSDGSSSLSVSEGTETVASSTSPTHASNAHTSSTPNHTAPARQRSIKRNGANSSSSNGGTPHPPGVQGPVGETQLNNSSPRDHSQRNSHSRSANDHPQQMRNSFRNRNGGSHSRGDGSHYHHLGGRREQDPGNPDWNNHRHYNGRDGHMQSQRPFTRFIRRPPQPSPPPSTSASIMSSSPVRGFGSPMGFPEFTPHFYYVDSLRGMQFVAAPVPPHPMFFPNFPLHYNIVKQIDYYFSNENLIKDTFLRQNMDDQGWVDVKLVAGFKKVSQLTPNVPIILDAMRNSSLVEVQGNKIRRRNDWQRWIMPPPVQLPNMSSPQSSADMLGAQVQNISLEENANVRSGAGIPSVAACGSSSSGASNRQSELSSDEGLGCVSTEGDLNHSASSRISTK
ncbi:hypothetical protein K2173_006048 [Erythroxylum novogranatense]|uniref:HTH La-type RNA-binding domain-containing protein n=1 Tax=Erythroxylum novogranatense TaxID=1862640 RepID=A0AAV8TCE0_9ROSI|nr:hypothetical protein K2173_006048 [Erythroxylum novogranatense]